MKVLMLNGSNKARGNTYLALSEVGKALAEDGVDYEIFNIGPGPVRDCIGCHMCDDGVCVFNDRDNDGVAAFCEKAAEADGFVFGTPVYYAHPSGRVLSFLDRAFYSSPAAYFAHKPAASVVVARRAGTTASYDVMNKYAGICQMPMVGSTYWNLAYGQQPGEVTQDLEGMRTMRNLGHNMAWMVKSLAAAREAGITPPEAETSPYMNFIR
jgi:multimeric flavodoxin WrbA